MKTFNFKKEIILWILLAVPFIYISYVWNSLPDTIAIHFNIHGNPDSYGSKMTIFLTPAINIFIYFLLLSIPLIDPKKMNYPSFAGIFYKIRLLQTVFIAGLAIYITSASISGSMTGMGHRFTAAIFLFIALMGNFMINVKPNWFIGIRTPWTLSSDTVWKKTHQLGGRTWFYGGILCFVLSFLIKPEWVAILMLTFLLGSALFFVGYSFWLFKKEN